MKLFKQFSLLLFCITLVSTANAQTDSDKQIPSIIVQRVKTLQKTIGTKRRQVVQINQALINSLMLSAQKTGVDGNLTANQHLFFNFFEKPGDSANAKGQIQDAKIDGATTIFKGVLIDHPQSYFQIVVHKKLVGIQVFSSLGTYLISPMPTGGYVVEEEDPSIPFSETLSNAPSLPESETAPNTFAEDGSRVDIMIAYKTAAMQTMGGRDQMELALRENEVFTNTALSNSRTNLQVRFVVLEEVPNNIGSTLPAFRNNESAKILRDKRNQHKADLVLVIQNVSESPGAGTVPCNPNSFNSKYAYAYVRTSYLRKIRTVSHEIGHLLGAGHEPGQVDNCTLFNDSYGHYFSARNQQGNLRKYATILSYANSDNRVPYYSNPDVSYQGVATGISSQRDNAKAIRHARTLVANYRVNNTVPTGSLPAVCFMTPSDDAQVPGNTKITISATITDPDGIRTVELYWKKTGNFLACPGSNGTDWSCTRQGDVYNWTLDVGTGAREYYIRATDSLGNVIITPMRRLILQ